MAAILFKEPSIKKKFVFVSSYLAFLKDLADLSLNIENGITIMCKKKVKRRYKAKYVT